jgi:hypothetical protein
MVTTWVSYKNYLMSGKAHLAETGFEAMPGKMGLAVPNNKRVMMMHESIVKYDTFGRGKLQAFFG